MTRQFEDGWNGTVNVKANVRRAMITIENAINKGAYILVPGHEAKVVDLRTEPVSEDDICRTCGCTRREHTSPHGTCPGTDDNGWPHFDEGQYWVVPGLEEAATRMGRPYLASELAPGGRRKIILGAASPELVRAFLKGEFGGALAGLVDLYGDPERGCAEGYLRW